MRRVCCRQRKVSVDARVLEGFQQLTAFSLCLKIKLSGVLAKCRPLYWFRASGLFGLVSMCLPPRSSGIREASRAKSVAKGLCFGVWDGEVETTTHNKFRQPQQAAAPMPHNLKLCNRKATASVMTFTLISLTFYANHATTCKAPPPHALNPKH